MRSTLAAFLVVAFSLPAVSQEPPKQPASFGFGFGFTVAEKPQFSPAEEQLLARIKRLEKRIAELEARQKAEGSTYTRPSAPPSARQIPLDQLKVQPVPQDAAPSPRPREQESVPEGWQRFEFNGQTYYMVPADELPTAPGMPRR